MVNHAQLTVKAPAKDTGFNTAAAYISYNHTGAVTEAFLRI